jgi:hypothetical protein
MTHKDKTQRRREAAKFWESHGIDEGVVADDVAEHLEVRKPLSAMLSLRLDEDDLAKLKLIAKAQGIGVTTIARMLLHQCLEDPNNQQVLQALRSVPVKGQIPEIFEDSKIPPGEGDLEFLVLSIDRLNKIDDLVSQHAIRLFVEGLKEQAITITPRQVELFDKIKELQSVD